MKRREFINKKQLISGGFAALLICGFALDLYSGASNELKQGKGEGFEEGEYYIAPAKLDSGDILFSEILFRVDKGQAEFIEIYNASEFDIPLATLFFGVWEAKTGLWKLYDIGAKSLAVLKGKAYSVLSKVPENIVFLYRTCEPENFITIFNFPALTDAGGHLAFLRKKDTVVLEQMQYSEKMQHPLLTNTMGVSLERIRMGVSAMCFDNWHSAAQSANYATPGCENSQGCDGEEDGETTWFSYSSEYITPNNDGLNDYLQLFYNVQLAGFICTIRIFDSEGRSCKMLLNQGLLGASGVLVWDGFDDKQRRLRAGVYIILIELIHTNGKRKVLRKAIGLT